MIPNMYKIAGELTPTVFHVAARSVATHALSIFGDHSDVMAAATGFALLGSGSVQEDHGHGADRPGGDARGARALHALLRRLPHLARGQQDRAADDDDMKAMIDEGPRPRPSRARLSPDRPVLRGTAQNPDVFFQARETVNPFYAKAPGIVQEAMDRFAGADRPPYHLFDYVGAPDAERVIVSWARASRPPHETVDQLTRRARRSAC
jgi:pyruvate-ferredoxin/flavodoxin oxidoreductase